MSVRAYYRAPVPRFLRDNPERILGVLVSEHHHTLEEEQRSAWLQEISILQKALSDRSEGIVFLEFYIPRMGKRADAMLVSRNVLFVIEFKGAATEYASSAFDQVEDYALDLKNFHEGSHNAPIVPLLVATHAPSLPNLNLDFAEDFVSKPIGTNATSLSSVIDSICDARPYPTLDVDQWIEKGYKPTPTIVEAAQVLYRTHCVTDISRSDAGAKNLRELTTAVSRVIDRACANHNKAICFVTGVPGSGKTLAGLDIATRRSDEHRDEHAVFLSGNGPLVAVLREALARDKAKRDAVTKKVAEREVRSFIQNIHHFRDQYVGNSDIPIEKVVVFDEAQRAWTREQAAAFMRRKRGQPDFNVSEPEFLISVMDRHTDWCTIICLIGGGQEINTGEAGLSEWIVALKNSFPEWNVYVSSRISLPEYTGSSEVEGFMMLPRVHADDDLHLGVSMRSFRAEKVSAFVGNLLDNVPEAAKEIFSSIRARYPIFLTRDLAQARAWLRSRARGTERFGLVAASGAQRLRPEGIHVKVEIDPSNWFLNDANDIRSSSFLEDVANEFTVQGLELDWVGVCWDADFYHDQQNWRHQAFKGTKWQKISDRSRQVYLKNAYRVLLTRARQGMLIFVPEIDAGSDHTRPPVFYDGTFAYLQSCGLPVLE